MSDDLVDKDFAHAVRAAAKGNAETLGRILEARANGEGLSRAEVLMLSELHVGDLRRPQGRPAKLSHEKYPIVAALRARLDEGALKKTAVSLVAKEFNVSVRTVELYDSQIKIKD